MVRKVISGKFIKEKLIQACAVSSPWLMLILICAWGVEKFNERVDSAAYAYPFSVVSYGLTNANTDEKVLALIERWKHDEWGAQIGALRVLCEKDMPKVNSIGGEVLATKICRIVK